jgi:glutamate racemase
MKGAARDGKTNSGPIGIFDSGFGGLNTLRHLVAKFPENDYLYLGDAARVPYGPRPAHEICSFSEQAIDFLYAHGCRLIIFRAHTQALRSSVF